MVTTTKFTPAQGKAFMRTPAMRKHSGGSWAGWCCAFTYWFTGAAHSYATAYDAYQAAGKMVSTDYAKAPAGAIHYWKSTSGFRPGHVAPSLGNGIAAMATSQRLDTVWGDHSGTIALSRYIPAVKAGFKYLGWSYNFGAFRMRGVVTLTEAKAIKKTIPATYKVVRNDNLTIIGKRFGVSVPKLVALNKAKHPTLVTNPNGLGIGWTLKLK